MFVKIKRRGGKTYYELAHSKRTGASVVQYSVYLGPTLALTGQEWRDILVTTKFSISLRKLFPVVEAFIDKWNLPRATISGLQDATRMQVARRKPSSAYTLLGLAVGATIAEINRAYRQKVKLCHPDLFPGGGNPVMFRQLTEAKDKLVDALTPSTPTSAPRGTEAEE
jgi:hypothetical protein